MVRLVWVTSDEFTCAPHDHTISSWRKHFSTSQHTHRKKSQFYENISETIRRLRIEIVIWIYLTDVERVYLDYLGLYFLNERKTNAKSDLDALAASQADEITYPVITETDLDTYPVTRTDIKHLSRRTALAFIRWLTQGYHLQNRQEPLRYIVLVTRVFRLNDIGLYQYRVRLRAAFGAVVDSFIPLYGAVGGSLSTDTIETSQSLLITKHNKVGQGCEKRQ